MGSLAAIPAVDNPPARPAGEVVELRAALRRISLHRRVRMCAVTKCRSELGVKVTGDGKARKAQAVGVLTCNSVWFCAPCAQRIRARRMELLTSAHRGGLQEHPRLAWKMLSLTIRHHAGMPLAWLHNGLMKAWRFCRQQRAVQTIFRRKVKASARSVEITYSFKNGWHPHLHIDVLTSRWTEAERLTLRRVWIESVARAFAPKRRAPPRVKKGASIAETNAHRRMVRAGYKAGLYETRDDYRARITALCAAVLPSDEHGLYWSKQELRAGDSSKKLAEYMTDMGLELTMGPTKTTRWEDSLTPWQIAQRACKGDARHVSLWHEYERAMRTRRCIELDDRAVELARQDKRVLQAGEPGECSEISFDGAETVGVASVYVPLPSEFLDVVRAYERRDPRATRLWLEAAARDGPLDAASVLANVRSCLDDMVAALGRTWYDFRRSSGVQTIAPGMYFVDGVA